MFLNKIRNIFCIPDTNFVSATNVARAGKRGNICVGNKVSSFARAFRSEDENEYRYEFSVLSMRIRFGDRLFSKCACSEQKTRTRNRSRPPI